jgi:endonuclease/exonuclease/phosphatase family metal-dependent hydrolase
MAYLPAHTVPADRRAAPVRPRHWAMAAFLPLVFIVPLAVFLVIKAVLWIRAKVRAHVASTRQAAPGRSRLWVGLCLTLILVLALAAAGRRTPMGPQQGTGIQWPADPRPVAADHLRVATFNIHRGKGTDGVYDLKRTAGLLRDVDVAALNEVAGPSLWGCPDQAEQLGRDTDLGWLFAPNQRRWTLPSFGNGLLSRVEVGAWEQEPLVFDRQKSRSFRSLLKARTTLDAEPVTLLVTHLDTGPIRSTQLQSVLRVFGSLRPAILLGDLNMNEADPAVREMLSDANNVDALGQALGGADPKDRVDWIVVRGLKVLSGGMVPAGASDHPCFWVEVALAEDP